MKFAIFVYVVAIACVARAQWFSLPNSAKEKIEEAKQKTNELTKEASNLLNKTVEEVKEKSQSYTEQLKESAEKVKESAAGSVQKIVQGANEEIAEAEKQAKELGVKNTAECTGFTSRIAEASRRVTVDSGRCVTDKVQTGTRLVSEISRKSSTTVSDLYNLEKQIEQCDQSTGIMGKVSALSCFTTNGAKVSRVIATQIPSLAFDLKKLTNLITTLRPSLQQCVQTNINAFKGEVKATVKTVSECLRRQINSIKSG